MSLNDIILTPGSLTGLYASALVQVDGAKTSPHAHGHGDADAGTGADAKEPARPAAPAASAASPFKHLGNNRCSILVLVNYAGKAYLPDEELEFLTKMLLACKLSLDDVAIVNTNHYRDMISSDYLRYFKPLTVFLFGIEPSGFGLPVSFPMYQVQSVAGVTFLYTPPLEDRLKDELFKSRLWISLKRIFNL